MKKMLTITTLLSVILSIGLMAELEAIKKDFPDIEKDENLKLLITTEKKTDYSKVAQFPTNEYNKFFEVEVKSVDLLKKEADETKQTLKVYTIKGGLYSLAVMYANESKEEVKTDLAPVAVADVVTKDSKKKSDVVSPDVLSGYGVTTTAPMSV